MIETYEEFLSRWTMWCASGDPSSAMKADALHWVMEYPNIGRAQEIATIWRKL